MPHIHINIGSNKGDRAALIERAVAALCRRIDPQGRARVTLSPIEESEPWGFESDNSFLNLGLMIDIADSVYPHRLLSDLQAVEMEIDASPHRHSDGSYADRSIDIDLIAVGDMVVDDGCLQLPHPRMHLRDFVLRPISILDPAWRHPLVRLTASELLRELDIDYPSST